MIKQEQSGVYYKKDNRLIFMDQEELIDYFKDQDEKYQKDEDLNRFELLNNDNIQKIIITESICKSQDKNLVNVNFLPYLCDAKHIQIKVNRKNYFDHYTLYPLLEQISHFSQLSQLVIDQMNFYQFERQAEYQLYKCISKSFPLLEILDIKLYGVTKLVNNFFNRLNKNIHTLKIEFIENRNSSFTSFDLKQFSQYKNVQYFSLKLFVYPCGCKELANIFKTCKVFKMQIQSIYYGVDQHQEYIDYLPQFITNSNTLETLQLSTFQSYIFLKMYEKIKSWPLTLKNLVIDEDNIFSNIHSDGQLYLYQQEMFLYQIQQIIPELLVFHLSMKGFQYQNEYYTEKKKSDELKQKELEENNYFLESLTKALFRCNNLQQLELRFGGSLCASEKQFREFFQAICIKGLKILIIDLEKWHSTERNLNNVQELHLISFFFKNLRDECSESLISLKYNFDGWDVFENIDYMIEELMRLPYLTDLITMGCKNRLLLSNKRLIILEQSIRNKNKYLPILQKMKQVQMNLNIRIEMLYDIAVEFQQIFDISYKLYSNRDPFGLENIHTAKYILERDKFYKNKVINPSIK